jgi:hypothetical protein
MTLWRQLVLENDEKSSEQRRKLILIVSDTADQPENPFSLFPTFYFNLCQDLRPTFNAVIYCFQGGDDQFVASQ